jgi:hypothetical protein
MYSVLTRSISVQLLSPNGKVCSQEPNFRQSKTPVKAKVSSLQNGFTGWFKNCKADEFVASHGNYFEGSNIYKTSLINYFFESSLIINSHISYLILITEVFHKCKKSV